MRKKAQIASNTVIGILAIIFTLIIVFVMLQQISGAGLFSAVTTSQQVVNESGHFLNTTGSSLSLVNATNSGYTATAVYNFTSGALLPAANYSLSAAGVLTNGTPTTYNNVSITYSYLFQATGSAERSTDLMSGNLTGGVDNLSRNIPTFFTIIAALLILAFVVLLWITFSRSGLTEGASL